jgi:uncharacterized ferredoxin-like protein
MSESAEEVYLIIRQAHRAMKRDAKNIRVPPKAILNMAVAAATCCKPDALECSNCGRTAND